MRELTIEEIHKVELDALVELDRICRDNGFKYMIYYGTLLGAVRHGGFIPWDDDIDIIMPRPDFEALLTYCESHKDDLLPYRLIYFTNTPNYAYPIGRFSDTRYHVDVNGTNEYGLGLFVDIYPYDGCGNELKNVKSIVRKNCFIRHFLMMAGTKNPFASKYGFIISFLKRLAFPLVKKLGPVFFINIERRTIRRYSYAESKYVCPAMWLTYGEKEIVERYDIEETETILFEGTHFMCPKNPQNHLKRLYGDFKKLPPLEKQVSTHDYKAYQVND